MAEVGGVASPLLTSPDLNAGAPGAGVLPDPAPLPPNLDEQPPPPAAKISTTKAAIIQTMASAMGWRGVGVFLLGVLTLVIFPRLFGGTGNGGAANDALHPTYHHGTGVTADLLGYGEIVSVPWETTASKKGNSNHAVNLAFLYCWHIRGERAAQQWLAQHRGEEDGDAKSARPLNEKLRQYRDHRCIGADEDPSSPFELPPLWEQLLADDESDQLPSAHTHEEWAAVVNDYVETARALGGRAMLEAMNPRVNNLFFHPATTTAINPDMDPDSFEPGYFDTWTSLPGRLAYRVVIHNSQGHLRPRMVDHFALVAVLNGWANTWMARLDKYLGAAASATQEPRCVCPAHLGILGSGMHFSYGPEGMTPSKEACPDSWRILLGVTLDQRGQVGFRAQSWTPSPMPNFHAFPATLDDAFIQALDNATTEESLPATSLFRYYEVMPALREKLVDKVVAADTGPIKLGRRLRQQLRYSGERQAADGISSMSRAREAMEALEMMTMREEEEVGTTAETLVLNALDFDFKRVGDATADDTRCFLYCQHLEEWLLNGLPEASDIDTTSADDAGIPEL